MSNEKIADSENRLSEEYHYDENGNSLLHLCDAKNFNEALKLTPDVNHRNHMGETALYVATNNKKDLEIVKLLLQNGADPNVQNDAGETTLHAAVHKNNMEIVKLLFHNKVNPHIQNTWGDTALHIAAYKNNLDMANLLFTYKINPNIQNKKGETFWNTSSLCQEGLSFFRKCKKNGTVLKSPPRMKMQKGLTCAISAVHAASQHLRAWYPELFGEAELPPPTKSDDRNAKSSLRQVSKEQGITHLGEVLKASELAGLLNTAGCDSLISDINDYKEFIDVIQKANEQNLPVLIPFAWDSDARQPAKFPNNRGARGLHWAMIIGSRIKEENGVIILAQWANYHCFNAGQLFNSFNKDEAKPSLFPDTPAIKKKGETWDPLRNNDLIEDTDKTRTIPGTELKDFWGKLIIALPPNYDISLLNLTTPVHVTGNKI
jgi:Ankyrin repeats (3 copies)